MTTTITIKDKPVNATYQNITGLTGGAGVEAAFDVTKTNGVYSVVLDSLAASAGRGYVAGDTITLAGTALVLITLSGKTKTYGLWISAVALAVYFFGLLISSNED